MVMPPRPAGPQKILVPISYYYIFLSASAFFLCISSTLIPHLGWYLEHPTRLLLTQTSLLIDVKTVFSFAACLPHACINGQCAVASGALVYCQIMSTRFCSSKNNFAIHSSLSRIPNSCCHMYTLDIQNILTMLVCGIILLRPTVSLLGGPLL